MNEKIQSPFLTDEEPDEIEEIIISNKRFTKRRTGKYFSETDFIQTRADKIKEVNKQLIPLVRALFIYCYMMALALWLIIFIYPAFYIRNCEAGQYESAHITIGIFLCFSFIFEYFMAKKIVKIIQPLSGHNKLSITQHVKLVSSMLGKLDMYTDFGFVALAFSCNSYLAPFALALMVFFSSILMFTQIKAGLKQEILGFQLSEYLVLFDLLGKYETMYLEGEKSIYNTRKWAKKSMVLPAIRFFAEDIGQFVIQILFLLEMREINTFVILSLSISLSLSFILLAFTYIKVKVFKPNLKKEQELVHIISTHIKEGNHDELMKLIPKKKIFRKFDHETRADILKAAAKHNFDIFNYLVSNRVAKNDAILQSESFHAKMLAGLRHCKVYPDSLILSFELLRIEKSIFINANKRISVSTEGTILHCLVEDPYFLIRTLKSEPDLIKYVVLLGIDVNIQDKFGETAVTLAARLNLETLIRSCSTQTLKELFELNEIQMEKEFADKAIKAWACRVIEYLVINGAYLIQQNKKNKNVLEIAKIAGNNVLCNFIYRQFGVKFEGNFVGS